VMWAWDRLPDIRYQDSHECLMCTVSGKVDSFDSASGLLKSGFRLRDQRYRRKAKRN
jgi:hypothetical protein